MIKISHVMTFYTIKLFLCMCITSFLTYTTLYDSTLNNVKSYIMMYFIYMYCKLNKLIFIELASNSFVYKWIWCYVNKTEANLASTNALAARCVRVIHAQCVLQFALLSRTLLRSSSNNEPSDPPYRIIFFCIYMYIRFIFNDKQQWFVEWKGLQQVNTITTTTIQRYDDDDIMQLVIWHNGATQSNIYNTSKCVV